MFDTVFVQTGSATQIFTVRNNGDNPVRIPLVRLGGGNASYYRLNVNGTPGKLVNNVEIGPRDSIFIFVEVTIPDPGNPNTPFIVNDSILFEFTNGSPQKVNLVAFGQRAHFHHAPPNTGRLFFLSCNEIWTNDLPHVIYGYAVVDSGCTLTIQQGARVHSTPASGILVLSSATLKVNGTLQEPVTFQGSRLGDAFKDIPGQWDGIYLLNATHNRLVNGANDVGPGTKNCSINYAIIKNGNIGLQVDTVFAPNLTTLQLDNTIIKNMAGVALYAQGSTIRANNCVFANSGQYLAALLYGGKYCFLHCTFANYWNDTRQTPSVLINNYFGSTIRPIDSAYFGNCIVYGNIENEIGFDSAFSSPPFTNNYIFDHTMLKVGSSFSTSSSLHYKSIIRGQDPLFKNTDDNNYEIDSVSAAVNAGDISITNLNIPLLNTDLKGSVRPQGAAPDMGAYERR